MEKREGSQSLRLAPPHQPAPRFEAGPASRRTEIGDADWLLFSLTPPTGIRAPAPAGARTGSNRAGGAGAAFLPLSPTPPRVLILKARVRSPACWRGHRAAEGVRPRRAGADGAGAGGDRAAAAGPESP